MSWQPEVVMDGPVCFGGEHGESLVAVGQLSLSALPGSLNGQCSASVGHLGMDEVVQFVCWQGSCERHHFAWSRSGCRRLTELMQVPGSPHGSPGQRVARESLPRGGERLSASRSLQPLLKAALLSPSLCKGSGAPACVSTWVIVGPSCQAACLPSRKE